MSSLNSDVNTQELKEMTSTWTSQRKKNQSAVNVTENCKVLGNNSFVPWDSPGNLVSWETEELMDRITGGIIIPLFFILGTPANIINMMVFFKQGLQERINVCLFSLALVDLLHLTPVFIFHVERVYSQFTDRQRYGTLYRFTMNNNLLGFYGFSYGSMLLAAIISIERCVCVVFPLRAKRCIPTKMFAIIIVFSVSVVSFLRFVVTAQYQVACYYEVKTQRRSWQAVRNDYHFKNKAMLNIIDGVFFGFCLSMGCQIIVLMLTIITAIKLRQTLRWRSYTSSGMSSPKEIGVTKMLISLSIEFLVLSFPVVSLRVTSLFPSVLNPAFHTNLYRMFLNLNVLCFYASSSVNFVVYYLTGSKYRETLHALLGLSFAVK